MSAPYANHSTYLPPIGGLMSSASHPPSTTTLPAMHPRHTPTALAQHSPSASNADHTRGVSQPSLPPGLTSPPPALTTSAVSLSQRSHPPQHAQQAQQELKMAAPQPRAGTSKPPPPPLDTMRAYRACLNCRSRKSKCDLEINQGRPPCRRCQREARECVLGESHRGGRRVRKKPKLEDGAEAPPPPVQQTFGQSPDANAQYSPSIYQSPSSAQHFQSGFQSQQDGRGQGYPWPQQSSARTSTSETGSGSRLNEPSSLTTSQTEQPYGQRKLSTLSNPMNINEGQEVQETIASADLQNPSDALDILAQVADRAEDGDSSGDQNPGQSQRSAKGLRHTADQEVAVQANRDGQFHYKPVSEGLISPEMIYSLFPVFQEFFHPFFPIAPQESFDRARLPWMSRAEPHLFAAILTVASKDNEQIHHICYDHMQQLVSMILAGADADIEAVEALLLLSQWVSHHPQASVAVGRGEEDRVAWMYIGTALRLGYFLGIDRSSFKPDSREDPVKFKRKRLVWLSCYMCDRQVSVRVGKGFWARGPGPLTGLKANDFPTLKSQSMEGDNWGLILQANLEIIQIFSNVHDILYSSKGHGWKEMLEGRYAKYLDDFRTSIRNWNDVWGNIVCSSRLKASLMLTYDYLRLYVNAFAYQATISRALTFRRDSQHKPNRPMPLIDATTPDARFIYEALDAAKSLLSTFTTFVEPETLRYMPSSYYLFIIYSAVFLYKARSTTTMTDDERTKVRRMISQTIERLQKSSVGANNMGSRYARLLQLLWRKAPKPNGPNANNPNSKSRRPTSMSERMATQPAQAPTTTPTSTSPISSYRQPLRNPAYDQSPTTHFQQPMNMQSQSQMNLSSPQHYPPNQNPTGTSTFSWLDLGATWNFATQNNSVSNPGSGGEGAEMEEVWDTGMSPYDMEMGLLTDYSVLEGDNPTLIF